MNTSIILYVHNNPVHHGFCTHPIEYPWSSYITCISQKQTKLQREKVVEWFQNFDCFINQHNQELDISEIDKWLELSSET